MEILYKFAKEKHYNIKIISISSEERLTYIKEGKANITLGAISITEEREKDMLFSDPLYDSPMVLVVRIDSKTDELPIEIQDSQYDAKANSNVDVNVDFSGKIKTSSCIFPPFYSHEFLINCTINDIKDVNASNGFKYVNTTDKIVLLYDYLEADTFLQANSKLKGHKIITESDKSQNVCPANSPSSPPSEDNASIIYQNKRSSSGLSTGGTIGIIIPCGLVLLVAAGFALMHPGPAAAATQLQYNPSEIHMVSRQNVSLNNNVIQQPQVVQPVQVV